MKRFSLALMGIVLTSLVSCSKDNNEEEMKTDGIVGMWTATASGYDLKMKITPTDFRFDISKPGKGGTYDKGEYLINGGKATFVGMQDAVLATGGLTNGKLMLTFVNPMIIGMIGTEAASKTVFTREEENSDGTGHLVVQNLSQSYDITMLKLYNTGGDLLNTDEDRLPPEYQFSYKLPVGSYIGELTDEKGKTFRLGVFKIIKDKYTVLRYDGSSAWIEATGIDMSSKAVRSLQSSVCPPVARDIMESIVPSRENTACTITFTTAKERNKYGTLD